MSITYTIAIDFDDDGTFTELGDNITAEILKAEWQLGLSAPYETVSTIAEARILVRNASQDFSPEISGNLISKRLRIQSDDGTVCTHFVGYIDRIEPQAGDRGSRLAEIIAYGRERELQQHHVRLPLQTDVRADEAIADILSQIDWRYDVLDGMCIIGRDSIGSSDIFPDDVFTQSLDTGKSVFAFLADNWEDGLPAHIAIDQLAQGETGRFFFNREGEAVFYNRHHLLTDDSPAATFSDDMTGISYDYGGIVNELEAVITPRSIGTANTKIWSLASPLRIKLGTTVQVIAHYEIDDESVGAIEVLPPQFQVYSHPTILTQEMTSDFQVILIEAGLSAAVLEIRNHAGSNGHLTQLDIYGTPLITGDALTIKARDSMSVSLYGKRALKMILPVITDVDEVESIIEWELQRRSEPHGMIRTLQTNTRNHPSETLSLTLFDPITVEESQTGHEANYHIIAEHHTVDMGGTRHRVTWLLEPAESKSFFIIGVHSIGDDVILAPR